jgi:AraC-like DNA-binding protein
MAYDRPALVNIALRLLRENPNTTLRQLSSRLGVDRHTLERAFLLVTGDPLRRHKRQAKLNQVCDLLSEGIHLSIKEVAFRVGFSSQAAFARFVRESTGQTPLMLRSRLRESECGDSSGNSQSS